MQIFGVPMPWMAKWVGGYPLFYAEAHGARIVDVDGHYYVDFALGDTGSMPGHSPEPTVRAVARRIGRARRRDDDDADRGLDLGGRRAAPALRPALLAVRAHGDRRQPLRPAHRAPDPAPAQGARLQLVLPRLGRRDGRGDRRRRRDGAQARQRRAAGRSGRDDRRRRVQRPGGRAPRARAPRHRLRPDRAGAHEHRHRAARAGVPRGSRAGLPRDRDAARLRRDAHDLGRARRLRGGLGTDARHPHDRQVARRRRARRGLRRLAGGARPDRGRRRGRLPGLGRRRRHARGQRALAGGHARDAGRGAHRRGVRCA